MTWKCKICGKHGFGSTGELVVGYPIPQKQRHLGDLCDECSEKLLDYDNYEVQIVLRRRSVKDGSKDTNTKEE